MDPDKDVDEMSEEDLLSEEEELAEEGETYTRADNDTTAESAIEQFSGQSEEDGGEKLGHSLEEADQGDLEHLEKNVQGASLDDSSAKHRTCDSQEHQKTSKLLNGDELLEFFRTLATGSTTTEGVTTIGLVGGISLHYTYLYRCIELGPYQSVSDTSVCTKQGLCDLCAEWFHIPSVGWLSKRWQKFYNKCVAAG